MEMLGFLKAKTQPRKAKTQHFHHSQHWARTRKFLHLLLTPAIQGRKNMSDVQALLIRCRALGAEFIPTPEAKLKVKAPIPLPENLREALRQRKAEVLALL